MSLKLRSLWQRRQAEHLLCECGGLGGHHMNQKSHPPSKKKKKSLNVFGSVTSGSIYKVGIPWYARKKMEQGPMTSDLHHISWSALYVAGGSCCVSPP